MKKEICHVCKKEKKPYTVILTNNILSLIEHKQAREEGPICERCNNYFAMTEEFKDATPEEFEIAKKSVWFANRMKDWWEKDKKLSSLDEDDLKGTNKRDWEGTVFIAKWCREKISPKQTQEDEK